MKVKGFVKRNKLFCVLFLLFLMSLAVYITSRLNVAVAEFTSRYISVSVTACLSFITDFPPFSIAELGLLMLLPLFILAVARSFRALDRGLGLFASMRGIICVALVTASLAVGCFFPCYFRNPLEENLGIKRSVPETERLKAATMLCGDELQKLNDEISFGINGTSHSALSFNEMAKELNESYKKLSKKHSFLPRFKRAPKPIALSDQLTYLYTAGIYTFITGEANVNINYPDFVIPFSMAHEMAHQRGIAREEEANFMAFIACLGSDNAYIRYSGYINMYDYLRSALALADMEAYYEAARAEDGQTTGEFAAYSAFFDKYRDSKAAAVAEAVNDTYLKANGQAAGSASYGLVVELAVEWLLGEEVR